MNFNEIPSEEEKFKNRILQTLTEKCTPDALIVREKLIESLFEVFSLEDLKLIKEERIINDIIIWSNLVNQFVKDMIAGENYEKINSDEEKKKYIDDILNIFLKLQTNNLKTQKNMADIKKDVDKLNEEMKSFFDYLKAFNAAIERFKELENNIKKTRGVLEKEIIIDEKILTKNYPWGKN